MRLKLDGTWRRALQGACWFLALIASAAGQVLDTPLSVPVDIAGRFLAEPYIDDESYEPAYVSITTGAGSPVYWSSQDSGWIEGPWQLAMMIPGRTYLMTLSSDHAPSSEVHFIAPPGMRVLVDNIERQTQTFGSSATFKVRVEYANEPFAEPGVAPSLQPIDGGRIFWFVGMGRLKNGRSAGVITLAESSPYTSLGPNSFIYEQESTEVIQKPAAGSLPRQIHAPQCFVQIRNGSSSQPFVIEFYTRLQVGAYDPQTQHYAVSGEPFASYEITNAGYPFSSQSNSIWIARRLRQNGQVRSSTTYLLRTGTGYDEENDDNWESWEASPWNSGGGEKITASTHSNDGSEVIEYRDASWNVSKRIRKVYGNFLWGKELVQLTVGEGDSDPQTTTFAYHSTNPGQYGNYRRLKSVVLPTGNWTMFDYYDDLPRRGQIAHVYRPWLDVPAAPTANVNSGLVTTYTYTVDWTGKPVLPSTIETTANGSSFKTGRQEFAYANGTVDGLPVVTETRKDYSDATQYLQTVTTRFRADADAANHFYPGLLHSVRRPDGTMTVQLFQSGIFQIANRVLTPDANGLEWEHVVLEGTTSTKDTTALPAYFGLSTDANFRVMALRSSGASQVYSVNGVLISDRQSIYDGADWTTIGRNRRAYQDGVWPLWVSHDTGDPLTNWTVVANTWDRFQLKTSTDETGVSRQFGYDSFSDRLQKMTRDAAGPLSALPVSYSYNCSGQVTAERLGQEGWVDEEGEYHAAEQIAIIRGYDLAGRPRYVTPSTLGTTAVGHDSVARTRTAVNPDGNQRIETFHRDGHLLSLTGAAVVPEYYTYGRETDGTLWTQVNIASATSARWRKVWTDWLGRTVKTERPGFTGQPNFIEDYFYEGGTGRLQKLKRTGYAPERYEYDALSRLVRTGTDVDNSGTLVPSSNDRIAETDRFFEYLEGAWWLREDTKGCLTPISGVATTISTVRTRLTGLTETLRAETRTTDVDGTVLTRVVTVDRPAKTVITTETGLASASTEERTVAGFPITIKTRAGVVHTTNYDSLGRKVGEIDPRTGGSFTFGYKTSTGLREWTRDGGGVPLSTVAYDSSGRVVSDRDANNQSAYFSYNSRGQLSRRWGATSYPVEYAYNSYGERTAMRTFRNTALSFSAVSWPLADTLNDNPATPPADGDRTLWAFDAPSGLLWKKTDAPTAEHPNGKTAMFSYTPRGQTYQRTSARGIVTTYRYFGDSAGEPETGELRTVDYNDATPDVSYTYTRLGQIASVTDNTGVRAFGYAASTSWRLASETLSAYFGSRVLTRRYDTAGGDYTFGTYAAGHMQGREEGFELGVEGAPARDLRQTMVFANYGRFAGIRTEAANTTAQDIVYSYIPTAAAQPQAGLPSRLVKGYTVSGTNFAVSRGYAAMLDLVTWIESKWNTTNLVRFDYTYNSLRQRKFSSQSGDAYADYGATSGMFHRYHYNTRGELESAALYRGTGADNPSSTDEYPGRRFEYRYDPIGNRRTAGATGLVANDDEYVTNALNQHTQKENNTIRVLGTASLTASLAVMGTPPSGPAPTVTRKDKAFAAEVFPANTGGPARGTVDVYAAQPGGAAGGADLANKTTRSYTAPRQTQSLTYDDDGNLTYDGVWSYSYDAENRLTSMISVLPAGFGFARQRLAFGYDYRGRRFYKEVFDLDNADSLVSARRFIYNGWDLVAELDAFNPSNVVLARSYTWGLDVEGSLGGAGGVGALVRMVDHVAGKTLLPCYDGNGNVVALANGASGTLEAIYEYSPFGELLRAEGTYAKANPFPFSTKFQGEETGLVYYGARFYSPGLGRFLNRDPIAEQGGLNLYGFCGNDGINRWDVLGMFYFGVPPIKQEDSGGHGRSRDRDSKNSVAPDPWLYDLPAFVFYAASGNIQVPPPIRAGPRDSGGTSNGSGPNRGGPLDGIVSRNRAIAAELGVSDDYERQVRSADGLRDVIVNGTQLAADLNVGLIVAQMLEGRSVTGEKYGVKDYVIGAVSLIPPAGRGQAVARCSREESEPS